MKKLTLSVGLLLAINSYSQINVEKKNGGSIYDKHYSQKYIDNYKDTTMKPSRGGVFLPERDTTCTLITRDEVIKLNYYDKTFLRGRNHSEGSVFIDVGYNQVECIKLFDQVLRIRKIILTYDDGTQVVKVVDSKANSYYALGPVRIEVKRPKILIAR
tara:strand:+ start:230 stop:703 length:474 start_codon:yes stop_codon:yes gene_type:complete